MKKYKEDRTAHEQIDQVSGNKAKEMALRDSEISWLCLLYFRNFGNLVSQRITLCYYVKSVLRKINDWYRLTEEKL